MIGVFGGSGFYEFLTDPRVVDMTTPYGAPSAPYRVGTIDDVEVAFLPRHGDNHQLPAHKVPFRANVHGMKQLGVDRIISPCAVGSLQREYAPGQFAVSDQQVDRTWGRQHTFFDGPVTAHVSLADPYCAELRPLAVASMEGAGATVHDTATVVVIQGPRFSTRAESRFYAGQGWELINMTQAPEAGLARELEICFVNISVITDYDVGMEGHDEPVTHSEVIARFAESIGTLKEGIRALIPLAAQTPRACECASATSSATG